MSIKARREKSKMFQVNVAEALGVDQSTVAKWEAGVCKPTADNLIKLSKLFKCSIDSLLKEEG